MKNGQQPQVSTKQAISDVSRDLGMFHEISSDVWKVFKKYYDTNVSAETFAEDVEVLDRKYKDAAGYRFMQKLLKVYFDELREVRG